MNENRQDSVSQGSALQSHSCCHKLQTSSLICSISLHVAIIWLLGMVLSQTDRQCQSPWMILEHTPSDTVRWYQALSLWLVFFSSYCSLRPWLWMIFLDSSNFEEVASVSCRCSVKKGCFQNLREQQEVTGAWQSYYRHSEWSGTAIHSCLSSSMVILQAQWVVAGKVVHECLSSSLLPFPGSVFVSGN